MGLTNFATLGAKSSKKFFFHSPPENESRQLLTALFSLKGLNLFNYFELSFVVVFISKHLRTPLTNIFLLNFSSLYGAIWIPILAAVPFAAVSCMNYIMISHFKPPQIRILARRSRL
jgi:hypothetical protein